MGQGGEVTFKFDPLIKGTQVLYMAYNRGSLSK